LLYERTGERRGAGDISEKIEGQKARVQKARVIPEVLSKGVTLMLLVWRRRAKSAQRE